MMMMKMMTQLIAISEAKKCGGREKTFLRILSMASYADLRAIS
jgi:hypothetical protein